MGRQSASECPYLTVCHALPGVPRNLGIPVTMISPRVCMTCMPLAMNSRGFSHAMS